jgi:iron complex outermembrane receptor protein
MKTPLPHLRGPFCPRAAIPALFLVFAASLSAQTQTTPAPDSEVVKLNTFTVTAALDKYVETSSSAVSKTPTALRDLPQTVQVMNASFMGDLRALTLEDVYPYIVGMTRESNQNNTFTLRGMSMSQGNSTQSVQVDGLPGTASRYGSPTTANIERVEVLKGPVSVMYGQANPGGLLNISTKRPKAVASNTLTASVASYAGRTSGLGSDMSYTGLLDLTGPLGTEKKWLYRLILTQERTESFRNDVEGDTWHIYPMLTYRWDADTELTAQFEYGDETRTHDDGMMAPNNDPTKMASMEIVYNEPGDIDWDEGSVASLDFRKTFRNDWRLRVAYRTVYYSGGRRALENVGVTVANPIQNSVVRRRYREQGNVRRYNFGDINLYGTFGPEQMKHTLLLGVNGGKEYNFLPRIAFGPNVANINLYHPARGTPYPTFTFATPTSTTGVVTSPGTTGTVTRSSNQAEFDNFGAYISDQVAIGRQWKASASLRYESQDAVSRELFSQTGRTQSTSATVPSVGLVYQPSDRLSYYASYSESFKPAHPDSINANFEAGFPPETAQQYELGVRGTFLDGKLNTTVSVYELTKQNVLEGVGITSPDGRSVMRLIGEQQSKGIEVEATYLPRPHWQLQLGYTYIDATVTSTTTVTDIGARLSNVARNSGSFWTRYNLPSGRLKGFGAGLGIIYQGQRNGSSTNNPLSLLPAPAYTRVDTAFYWKRGRYDFAINVQNLFDEAYLSSTSIRFFTQIYPGDPRKVTASLKIAF